MQATCVPAAPCAASDSPLYYSFVPHPRVRFIIVDSFHISAVPLFWSDPCQPDVRVCEGRAALMAGNPNFRDAAGTFRAVDYTRALDGLPADRFNMVESNGALGAEQRAWLHGELQAARAHGQRCVVFAHQAIHPDCCHPDATCWDAADVRAVLAAVPGVVAAWWSGHDHDGGYAVDADGTHHIAPPAPLEVEGDELAHARVDVDAAGLVVHWRGRAPLASSCAVCLNWDQPVRLNFPAL